MGGEILRIETLHVSVDGTPIRQGLSLTIYRAEIHAIMGSNSAGKSDLANVVMVTTAYEITSGRIVFKGEPL